MAEYPDGGSKTTHGAYAPARRMRSVTYEIARCDLEQSKALRAWAERIEAVAKAPAGSPEAAMAAVILIQIANEMTNVSFVVEKSSLAILERIG